MVYFQWETEGTAYALHLKFWTEAQAKFWIVNFNVRNQNPVQGKHQASIKHKEPYSSDLHGLLKDR